jgi:uncharacterized protein (TIGR02001 family)
VTATAPQRAPRGHASGHNARDLRAAAAALLFLWVSAPASAEVGAAVSLLSEARLRGYSLSAGNPVAQLDLSYDHPDGFYAALSASIVAHQGAKPLGLQENIGFAKKLESGPIIDVGIVNSNYSRQSGHYRSLSYTEIYAGLIGRNVASHVYVSPNYFDSGVWTLYGDIDAGVRLIKKFNLTGHVGALKYLHDGPDDKLHYDWQVGVKREFGRFAAQLAVSGGGPGKDFYYGREHHRTRVVIGVSCIL